MLPGIDIVIENVAENDRKRERLAAGEPIATAAAVGIYK
jgi:hypothetical protein